MVLQSIKFDQTKGTLEIIDQLLLPNEARYIKIKGVEDGWSVINKMQVEIKKKYVYTNSHIVAHILSHISSLPQLFLSRFHKSITILFTMYVSICRFAALQL